MTTILKNSAPPMVGRDEGSARRRALKLHKGPGRLTRTTRREWTLMLWASAVTHAREFLIQAQQHRRPRSGGAHEERPLLGRAGPEVLCPSHGQGKEGRRMRPLSKQRGEDIAIAIMVCGLVLILGMLGGAFFIVAREALKCLP